MDIVDPRVEDYLASRHAVMDTPVLLEMEAEAAARGFPIVGRTVGVALEVLARAAGARRVVELGSGYGYSAYWFARAVGPDGEVHCTDTDPDNAARALDYLRRAGLARQIRFHVGDALEVLQRLDPPFDLVYNDIDKAGYPAAWRAAREAVRVGGLYVCDNVLWSGRVVGGDADEVAVPDEATAAIVEHNRMVAEDERYLSTIVPIRDGVMVAVRLG